MRHNINIYLFKVIFLKYSNNMNTIIDTIENEIRNSERIGISFNKKILMKVLFDISLLNNNL